MQKHILSLSAFVMLGSLSPAWSQVVTSPAAANAAPAKVIRWSDPSFAALANKLTGSYKSAEAIDGADIFIHFAPVVIADVPDALYMEVARADALDRPYRQGIVQLEKSGDKTLLKTMDFRKPRGEFAPAIGTWAAPDAFSSMVAMSDLSSTLAIELLPTANGFGGQTAHAFPTSAGGATEMTSQMSFDGTKLQTADRGMGADGKQVWGPAAGAMYTFAKVPAPLSVKRFPGGLICIEYPGNVEGEAASKGMRVRAHYLGVLEDGTIFDSSYKRGSPFEYAYGQPMPEGWMTAMADAQKGMKRRLIIPAAMGFGAEGNPRSNVPANATLIMAVDVLDVMKEGALPAGIDIKPVEMTPELMKELKLQKIKEMELQKQGGAKPQPK